MRLLELGLLRFGGFTDHTLDLSAPGLHLVFGRNEAGKSTALRGITSLLYGFPHGRADAYLHDEVLLSGRVRAEDGAELSFQRRKGRKNTLLSSSGEPIDETGLSRLLGGVSRSVFETTFGLDHERLRRGGQDLALGGGEVGQSLFDAGIGGGSVKRVLDELAAEAERLFTPRSRTRGINEALREYADQVKVVRAESTRPEAWAQQKQALELASVELGEINVRRADHKRQLAAAQELVKVLPLLARREAAQRELADVATARLLPDDAESRRTAVERELDSTEHDLREVDRQIAGFDGELVETVVSDQLLSLDEMAAGVLQERLGQYRRDRSHLGKRRGELIASEASVRRRLQSLGRGSGAEARSLVPQRAEVARVKALARERARLEAELEAGNERVAEAGLAVAEQEAAAVAAPSELSDLGGKPGLLEQDLPGIATVDEFSRCFVRLERERDKWAERKAAIESDAAQARAELSELQLAGEVPTEAELRSVRAEREIALASLRQAVHAGDAGVADEFAKLERLQRAADEVADRLRREAERVARFAASEAKRIKAAEGMESLGEKHAALDAERAAAEAQWRALWAGVEIPIRSPAEMRGLVDGWLKARERRRESLVLLARSRAKHAAAVDARTEQERALDAWRARWAEAVSCLGLGGDAVPEEADEMQTALGELASELDVCEGLRHRVRGMDQDCESFERDVVDLTRRHLPEAGVSAGEGVEAVATMLIQRSRANRAALNKREDLEARRAAAVDRASELRARSEILEGEAAGLMRAAGVSERAELPAAEAASTKRRRAEADLKQIDAELREACGTASVEAVRDRARDVSLPDARALVAELEDALHEIEGARDGVRDRVQGAQLGLERYDDRQSAADAQVEVEALLARIRSDAERWARVRVAWRVLHGEVERYRATHQAPLLERTNQLFPRLTEGRYRQLAVDHDAEPPVLEAVTADGARVPIALLSEGTRDQLYLALRLASLEHYSTASEPLPLCLDDVLINFDDPRSRAALGVFSEVTSRVQVLLFTHHEHVVAAARDVLSAGSVTVHELVRREPVPEPTRAQPA